MVKKHVKISNKELLSNARCECCNFSNAFLHDELLVKYTGNPNNTKRLRPMYLIDDKILCNYCYFPNKQYNELNEKTKTNHTDLGELEIELAKWNNILKQEGFLDI